MVLKFESEKILKKWGAIRIEPHSWGCCKLLD